MQNQFSRTEILIGKDAVEKLHKAKVAIFGIGGVGSFALEGLSRAGIENFVLVDNDTVSISNLNRQLIALHSTIDKSKVEVAKARILDINPNAKVEVYQEFFTPESRDFFDESFDYVIDCIDTITAKIELIVRANKLNVPIISSMGTGNKLDPTRFEITDIYKTSVCPLAKVMRKELRARDIKKLKVLYSKEEPIKHKAIHFNEETINLKELEVNEDTVKSNEVAQETKVGNKKIPPASISFVPSVAGLIIAGEVVKDIIT